MKPIIEKIDRTIAAIELVLTRNGHLFSIEDIDLLKECSSKLKKLKKELSKAKANLVAVVNLLDVFFGSNNIEEYFNS